MIKIFLLMLFVIPEVLFATSWVNEFPIYVYGDVSFFSTIYEFINSVVEDDAVEVIVGLGFTITAFIAGIKLKDGDLIGFGKSMIAPITLLALFFTPTVDVHITDVRVDKGYIDHTLSPDGGYQKVESVPYAIAFLPASAMFLVNVAIDLIDDNWASVHIANKFSSIGFQEISRATQQALNLSSFVTSSDSNSSKYEYDLNIYIKECIIKKALDYKSNASFVYAPSKPFPENLNPTNFPVNFGSSYIDYIDFGDNQVTNQTCTDAYSSLVSANATQIENAIETKINTLNPTKDFTSITASAAFREQIGDTANVIGTLKKAVATTVTGKFLQRQQSLDAVGVDGYSVATQLSIDTTLANLRSEGPAKMQWIARVLPDIIFIISGIAIAVFPLLIIVQSFMGATAFMAIANYFMGFFAFYFNLVGLALVQNIVSFYTSQEAQQSIAIAQNMPFSVDYISDFLIQQANMTGLAGMVGAASIFVLTPLIFYGEMKGFSAALSGVTGAFRGGVDAIANDTIRNSALEAEIDRELMEERNGMTEIQASKWLSDNGYSDYKRANMSSLETYSQIMKGYGAIGSGFTAQDLMHSGNVPDYIKGSYLQSTQQAMKTIGMGNSIDSIQNAGEVAMQDGQVMAESINATDRMRNGSGDLRDLNKNYDTEQIGMGMAASQFSKDTGIGYIGEQIQSDWNDNDITRDSLKANVLATKNQLETQEANAQEFLNSSNIDLKQNVSEFLDNSFKQVLGDIKKHSDESREKDDLELMNQAYLDANKYIDGIDKDKNMEESSMFLGVESINDNQENRLNNDTQSSPKASSDIAMLLSEPSIQSFLSGEHLKQPQMVDNDRSIFADIPEANSGEVFSEFDRAVQDYKNAEDSYNQAMSALSIQRKDAQTRLDNSQKDSLEEENSQNEIKSIEEQMLLAKEQFDEKTMGIAKRDELDATESILKEAAQKLSDGKKTNEQIANDLVQPFKSEFNMASKNLENFDNNLSKNGESTSLNSLIANSINQSVQQISSGQGFIDSKAFSLDGSFNEGNSQANLLQTGYQNQSRIQANKAMGMGKEDLTSDQMLSVQATSHASMLSEFQEGKTLRDKFGNNLNENGSYTSSVVENQDDINAINEQNNEINKKISSLKKKSSDLVDQAYDSNDDKEVEKLLKKADIYDAQANDLKSQLQTVPSAITNTQTQSLSYEDMIANEASSKLAGRMGSAKAFESTGFDMVASNVEYGAISQALSTASKIATQGGVEKAVAIDVAEASMKAAMQQGTLKGQIEEYAQKTGMTSEVAKQFATEIINGAKVVGELIGQGVIGSVKDVASTLSAAKTGSDIRSINTVGGDDKYIQLSKDQASLKTAQSITSANAAKNANFLNDDGITSEGLEAYGIQAGEQASILGVKRDLFFGNGSQGFIQKLRQQMKDAGVAAHIADGKSQEEAQNIMESAFNSAGFTNKANGQDAINALAKMGAMNYASSKTISAGGVQFNMGIGADGNTRIGQATTTESIEGGSKYTTEPEGRLLEEAARLTLGDGATQAQVKQEAARLSQSKHLMKELRSSGIDYLGMGVGEGARALLDKVGLAPESETGNLALGIASFGGATLGLAETAEQIKHKIDGKYIAKDGFSYQTGISVDKDGVEKPVFKEVKAGAEVNVNSSPELKEHYENNKDNFSLKKGTTGRAVGKIWGSTMSSSFQNPMPNHTDNPGRNSQDTKSESGTKTDKKQSIQNTPPIENSKNSITQNEQELKSHYNLTSSAQERKNEALDNWAKEQKADAVAKYRNQISKLEQPYSSKEIQAQKDTLTNSYYKQVNALDKKYGAQTYEEKGEMKTQAPDEYFEKIKNLNERYVAQNNILDAKDNQSLPSHVIEAKETLHNELQEKIQDIDMKKNMMKNANPQSFVKTSTSTISDDFIQAQPAPHKDYGKLPSSIKGGGIGALVSSLGMSINDIAHGKDWNHTLKSTGSELYSSVQSEGVVGTIRDMAYSGKENRMLIEKASNENSFFKTSALMGTSVVEGFAEFGGSVATVTNNYSRAAANTIWGSGSFTKNLLEQEKDDNTNNFNFTKDLNNYWENRYGETNKTIATINPNTGVITPNQSSNNINNSSIFSNNNQFENNTAQVIADSGEEQKSYIRDMGDSIEVQEEAMGELLDYLKVKDENEK